MCSHPNKGLILAATVTGVACACTILWLWKTKHRRARAIYEQSGFTKYRNETILAIELALECGEAIRCCTERHVTWKDSGAIDPVTETDQANEKLVEEGIRRAFPSHNLIGEESCSSTGSIPSLGRDPTWIVDPIDGTQNFVHSVPLSAVSIGFCDGGVAQIGVIYDPHHDELFVAIRGQGATMNGSPVKIQPCTKLNQAMVLADVGYERSPAGISSMVAAYEKMLHGNVQSFRMIGSSVLCLAWVACARANAFIIGFHNESGKPWDYCAGYVIAAEAGAHFRTLDDRTFVKDSLSKNDPVFDIFARSCICASSSELAGQLLMTSQNSEEATLGTFP